MTRALRMSLRATGQVRILATTVNMTVLTAGLFISHIVYARRGLERDDPWQPFFYAAMAASIVLGVVGFWASTQPDRDPRHRIAAVTIAGAMAVATVVVQILVYLGVTPVMTWWLLAKLITSMFWPAGGLVCLALSYLGEPLGLGEPGALRPSSPWIWMIAAPVAGLDILVWWLESRYDLPESTVLGDRRGPALRAHPPTSPCARRRGTGLGHLAAGRVIVPTYVVSLVGMASTGGGPLDREIVAPTTVVAVLAAVGGGHLLSRRRTQLKRSRA